MFYFSNGYACAIDSDKKTIAIQFFQRHPSFNEHGDFEKTEVEMASSIFVDKEMAANLGQALIALASEDDASNE